jgi:aldose 1-epimerase
MSVVRSVFGVLADGSVVESIRLSTGALSATIITYGATLQSLCAPDGSGTTDDIVLGHDDLESYVRHPNFFGVTVGRYANRIAGGSFMLDGVRHHLERNEGGHALHGGWRGFDKIVWTVRSVADGPDPTVVLAHTSADGSGGYPGRLDTRVRYTLTRAGTLVIAFDAATTRPTMVNLTNHSVFNLPGRGAAQDIAGHMLTIPASRYTPVDATLIPTGELRDVAGSVLDFRTPRCLGLDPAAMVEDQVRLTNGYNQNFALDKGASDLPELAARLEHRASGRVLEVLTTEPGIQLYCSNHLDGSLIGKGGQRYARGQGVALEPQKFPDAPNHPQFPSARVDPGKPYRHVMAYRLSVRA